MKRYIPFLLALLTLPQFALAWSGFFGQELLCYIGLFSILACGEFVLSRSFSFHEKLSLAVSRWNAFFLLVVQIVLFWVIGLRFSTVSRAVFTRTDLALDRFSSVVSAALLILICFSIFVFLNQLFDRSDPASQMSRAKFFYRIFAFAYVLIAVVGVVLGMVSWNEAASLLPPL